MCRRTWQEFTRRSGAACGSSSLLAGPFGNGPTAGEDEAAGNRRKPMLQGEVPSASRSAHGLDSLALRCSAI
jgi:hypothetical protein